MTKSVDSTLCVKACANVDVTQDLEKCEGKCVRELLDEQEEKENQKESS